MSRLKRVVLRRRISGTRSFSSHSRDARACREYVEESMRRSGRCAKVWRERGKQLAWPRTRADKFARMFCWKLRSRNDVQTEGRPRPPPGNTVITIITYRALILISPSYISLSIFLYLPPRFHGDSLVRRLGRVKADFFSQPFARVNRPRFIIGTYTSHVSSDR